MTRAAPRLVGTTAALAVALVLATAATGQEAPPVDRGLVVLPLRIAAELAPVKDGLLEWVRARARRAGVSVQAGREARLGTREPHKLQDALSFAAQRRAGHALIVDLLLEEQSLAVRLRLYEMESRELVGVAAAETRDDKLTLAANRALATILPRLVAEVAELPKPATQSLDELAATGRALRAVDQGELVEAWNELAGRSSPGVARMRIAIESEAQAPGTPRAEYARLLAARGEVDTAWEEIAEEVASQKKAAKPDPRVLLAAGEILLERGELKEARQHLEKAVRLRPKAARYYLGLGRAHGLMGDERAAADAFQRAAKLDSHSPRPLELQARHTKATDKRAKLRVLAGRRAAAQLAVERAGKNFNRAVRLEPALAGETREHMGALQLRVHDHDDALDSFNDAVEMGGPTATRLLGAARSQRGLGDDSAAEMAYSQALELAPRDATALRELGDLFTDTGRADEAVTTLAQAAKLEPRDATLKRSLARAHQEGGDPEKALSLYKEADELGTPNARALRAVAALEKRNGDLMAAADALEQAVKLEPASPELREELAEAYVATGNTAAAEAQSLLIRPPDSEPLLVGDSEPKGDSTSFSGLVASFGEPDPELGPALLLGVREPLEGKELVLDWLHPKVPDYAGLELDLEAAIAELYAAGPKPELKTYGAQFGDTVDTLYEFERDQSLDAGAIARVNRTLQSGAVFVARLTRRSGGGESVCAMGPHFEIELRRLSGQLSGDVDALGNRMCLAGGIDDHGIWDARAGALYLIVLLLVAFPFARGWGRLVVTFKFPPKTRPLFSVRITPRKRRSVKVDDTGDQITNKWKIEEKLQRISPFEKRLQGDRVVFPRVPARRKPYYVTVKGPMLDAKTGELVGAYQEEKTIKILRGKAVELEFDMRPKEASIEVTVYLDGAIAEQACVARRGVKNSLLWARGKSAFVYVGTGEHTIVAGADGRVAERTVNVETVEPVRIAMDLSSEDNLFFSDCPEAVMPYLEGSYLEAAEALTRAGQDKVASQIRAQGLLDIGKKDAAAQAFEEAGELLSAAELRAEDDEAGSAVLFEEAGEYARAAEAYRTQGDIMGAARAYERASDWENASDCYRELGEVERLINVLEKGGDYFEAAQLALDDRQVDRALHDYQQVEIRHPRYSEVCLQLGTILSEKGEPDLAIEKLGQARERMGDIFPQEYYPRLGNLFEAVGRDEDALEVYETLRRVDLGNEEAKSKVESLRKKITQAAEADAAATRAAAAPTPSAEPGRYEILGELGRGGMGVVYEARDTHLGRTVALKKLPENLKDHPTAVKLFLREARSAAALNHPNIVTVYDAGQEGDNYFISMEHLQGTPLDALLKTHTVLSPRDSALLCIQAATGLAYAHENRIIHRDIKSSNLFYTNDRIVKIMDFGLAKAVEEVRRNASMIAGTPYFMAPEQSAGEVVDHRADLYALGVTLYQLATGSVPFTEGDVTYHHRHTPPTDPRERVPEIPEAMASVILDLLAKDPADRIQSAAEVVERLRAATS